MDTPSRQNVLRLAQQRSCGEISSAEFFGGLSGIPVGAGDFSASPTRALSPPSWRNDLASSSLQWSPRSPPRRAAKLSLLSASEAWRDSGFSEPASFLEPVGRGSLDAPLAAASLPAVLTTAEATALVRSQLHPGSSREEPREEWPPSASSAVDRAYAEALAARAPPWAAPLGEGGGSAARWDAPEVRWDLPSDGSIDWSTLPRQPISRRASKSSCYSASSTAGLRASSRSSTHDLARRGELWELQREQKRERLRRSFESRELEECSFCPSVSKRSSAAAPSRAASEGVLRSRSASACRRAEETKRWSLMRDMESFQECTFTPDVSKSASSFEASGGQRAHAASRQAAALKRQRQAQEASASGPQYKPATNEVAPHMRHAQTYLRKNVFDRLAEPQPDPPRARTTASNEPSACEEVSCEANPSSAGAASSMEALWEFLRRQNHHEEERLRRLDQLEADTGPTLRPELNERSRRLVRRRQQRARSADAERRDQQWSPRRGPVDAASPLGASRLRRSASSDPRASFNSATAEESGSHAGLSAECSFHPEISRASSRKPSRGCAQLSTGDHLRREAHKEELREQQRREEEQHAPFAPHIGEAPKGVRSEGKLRLLEDPSQFLRVLRREQQAAEYRASCELRERTERELAACTFQPSIKGAAPRFVQRQAESHRARRQQEKENQAVRSKLKPDWR